MAERSELYAVLGHENPTIVRRCAQSGGAHLLGDVLDATAIAAFAREQEIDIAMVSADEPLAAGVVDALLAQGTRAVGPTRAGAEIEWNKVFARELLQDLAPAAVPRMRIVRERSELEEAIASFGSTPVVVKADGLAAGKGVGTETFDSFLTDALTAVGWREATGASIASSRIRASAARSSAKRPISTRWPIP